MPELQSRCPEPHGRRTRRLCGWRRTRSGHRIIGTSDHRKTVPGHLRLRQNRGGFVEANASLNCDALVELLRASGEETVELYGLWYGNGAEAPKTRESISVERLLDRHFYFKEEGFYTVRI